MIDDAGSGGFVRLDFGPAVDGYDVRGDLTFCAKSGQIRGTPRLRTSDESSVRIGLRRDLGAGELQVSTKPVSEKLFVLELQSSWTVASRAHSGESSAG